MKLLVLGYTNGNHVYRKLCIGNSAVTAWEEVSQALNEMNAYIYEKERLSHMRSLKVEVREVPEFTEADEQSKWMELP